MPIVELVIELFVEDGDVAGVDPETAKVFHVFGDALGADALNIECGNG